MLNRFDITLLLLDSVATRLILSAERFDGLNLYDKLATGSQIWFVFSIEYSVEERMIRSDGWNTWYCHRMVHLPAGLEIKLVFHQEDIGTCITGLTDFTIRTVKKGYIPGSGILEADWDEPPPIKLGAHASDGSYCQQEFNSGDKKVVVEYASEGNQLVCKVSPEESLSDARLSVGLSFLPDGKERWLRHGNIAVIQTRADAFLVVVSSDASKLNSVLTGDGEKGDGPIVFDLGLEAPFFIFFDSIDGQTEGNERIDLSLKGNEWEDFLSARRSQYQSERVSGDGMWGDCVEAIPLVMNWNTIWSSERERVYTPSPMKVVDDRILDGVIFEWDTFLHAILAGVEDEELAYHNIYAVLDTATERGFLPNLQSSKDRSQPPVGSYCVLKLYETFQRKELLDNSFPGLLRWHDWWFKERDGNRDGLLEWGTSLESDKYDRLRQSAIFETGLDDIPLYDDVVLNTEAKTMELVDVGLNSLWALDAWALSRIALTLGKAEESERLEREFQGIKERINEVLWSEDDGIYLNRYWDGRFSYRRAPTLFYPIIAGVCSREQAERMVKEHLLNEEEFWGEHVIPSISRDDPAFKEQSWVRGKIWPPLNFLVSEGLKRYGFYDIAHELAEKSVELFRRDWHERGHVHENYHALWGTGCNPEASSSVDSSPMYTWGALLPYLGLQELIDVELWGGMRFGNLGGEEASVRNIRIRGAKYMVRTGRKLEVYRDDHMIIEADSPIIIRGYVAEKDSLSFMVELKAPSSIVLGGLPGEREVEVDIGGERFRKDVGADGTLRIQIRASCTINLRAL